MFWRLSKEIGFEFLYEKMALVSEFHDLMMRRDGQKLMKVIVGMYDLFSEFNMDIADESVRMDVVCKREGLSSKDKVFSKKFFTFISLI